jgi:hypothetical protein
LRINSNVGCKRSSTNVEEASLPEIVRGRPPDHIRGDPFRRRFEQRRTRAAAALRKRDLSPVSLHGEFTCRTSLGPRRIGARLDAACTGWTDPGFTTLVVTVARFRHASGVEGLLRRIGAISELAGMRYWSTTHKRWQTLIINAHALSEAAGDRRREDFSPAELGAGRSLYVQQEDNLSGTAIYRMRIRNRSPDRLVFDTENTGAVRYLLMPIFPPGGMQSITFLDRDSQDVWRYYSIMRTSREANPMTAGSEASSINRAVAYYRHLAGIPTDKEPPAAP